MSNFTPEQVQEILDLYFENFAHRQYTGARYVPIFGRKGETSIEWDNSAPYEPLTIVLHEGNSYTSRQFVPTGVAITNTAYWAETGNFNAQIEQYRQEVTTLANMLPDTDFDATNTVKKYIDDKKAETLNTVNGILGGDFTAIDTVKKYIDDSVSPLSESIELIESVKPVNVLYLGFDNTGVEDVSALFTQYSEQFPLYFPAGKYRIDSTVTVKNSVYGCGFYRLWENNGTEFISGIDGVSNVLEVVGNSDVNSIVIEGITIKANGTEDKLIYYHPVHVPQNIYIHDCNLWNFQKNGIYVDYSTPDSRCVYIDQCSLFGNYSSDSAYVGTQGIYISDNAADSRISNCEIMGCKIGVTCISFLQMDTCHIYGGKLGGISAKATWENSIGLFVGDSIITNVYIDTYFVSVLCARNKTCVIDDFFLYWDNTIIGYTWELVPLYSDYFEGHIDANNGLVVDSQSAMSALYSSDHSCYNVNNVTYYTDSTISAAPNMYLTQKRHFKRDVPAEVSGNEWYEALTIYLQSNCGATFTITNNGGYTCRLFVRSASGVLTTKYMSVESTSDLQVKYLFNAGILHVFVRYRDPLDITIDSISPTARILDYDNVKNLNGTRKTMLSSDGSNLTDFGA